jgi:iron complex outermembrane recepter protein
MSIPRIGTVRPTPRLMFGVGLIALHALPASADALSVPVAKDVGAVTPVADDTVLSEITVTARKRVENVQDVPATVSVLSGQHLQDQNITSILQMRQVVPGMEARFTPQGIMELKIRGLGTSSVILNFEQSVGAFTDGIYIGHTRQFNASFFDTEQAEVVKGTQAALLGKNTSLGAIAVTTRRPGRDFAYDLTGSYEFEYGSHVISGGVDIPVSDTFRVRLAGQYDHRGGWVHNIYTGVDGPDIDNYGARLTAVWEPTSHIDVTGSYTWTKARRVGQAAEGYLDLADVTDSYAPYNVRGALSPFGAAGYPGDTVFDYKTDFNSPFGDEKDKSGARLAVLTANYTLDNGLKFTSLTGYGRTHDTFFWPTAGFSYYLATVRNQVEQSKQYSQEFRVTSPADKRLEFQAGVYLGRDQWSLDLDYLSYGSTSVGPYNAANPPPPPSASVALIPQTLTSRFDEYLSIRTDDLAFFGSSTFHITPKLSLTASGRYTIEKRSSTYSRIYSVGIPFASPFANCLGPTGFVASFLPTCGSVGGAFQGTQTQSVVGRHPDGAAGINYKLDKDVLLYGSYSKGTKGAGFSGGVGVMGQFYKAEVARTAELGIKSSFHDLRPFGMSLGDLRFNLAGFRTTITNLQTAISRPLLTGQVVQVVSGRNVISKGAELDVRWHPPVPRLELGLSVTYADTRNRVSPDDPTILPGTRIAGAPPWTGLGSLDYWLPLSERVNLKLNSSVDFRSKMNNREYVTGPLNCLNDPLAFGNPSCLYPSQSYRKVNLRVGIENRSAGWEVAVIGRNINNQKVMGYEYPSRGVNYTISEEPRTIALQVSVRR